MASTKAKKSKKKDIQPIGNVYVFSGYNNTVVTVTDLDGNTVCWGSAGNSGFKGSRKSTPYAAAIVGENTAKDAVALGVKEVTAYIKGIGSGRSLSIKNKLDAIGGRGGFFRYGRAIRSILG